MAKANYTYEIIGNGYVIKRDGVVWLKQTEHIPYRGTTLEESAQNHLNMILQGEEEATELENLKEELSTTNEALLGLMDAIMTMQIGGEKDV